MYKEGLKIYIWLYELKSPNTYIITLQHTHIKTSQVYTCTKNMWKPQAHILHTPNIYNHLPIQKKQKKSPNPHIETQTLSTIHRVQVHPHSPKHIA